MNEEELYNTLERYVRGKLPPEEATALEQSMANDPDLREQVRLHRLEVEYDEYLLREKLRKNVHDWITGVPLPEPPPSFWKTWGLPLLLIAFAVIGFWFIGQQIVSTPSTPAEQNVREENKSPVSTPDRPVAQDEFQKTQPSTTPNTRPDRGYLALAETNYRLPTHLDGGDLKSENPTDSATGPLAIGIRACLAGQYAVAIRELGQVTEATSTPDEYAQAREWLAHAWLNRGFQTRNFSRAVAHFQNLATQKDNTPAEQDRAEWYLLLSLLPDYPQQKTQVDTLLKKILSVKGHGYLDNAKEVQAKLEKLK